MSTITIHMQYIATYTSWKSSNVFCGVNTCNKPMIYRERKTCISITGSSWTTMTELFIHNIIFLHLHFCDWHISLELVLCRPAWHGSGSERAGSTSWWQHFVQGFGHMQSCRAEGQKKSQNAQRKMYTKKGNKQMFYCFIMVFYTLKKIIQNPKLNLDHNNIKAQENICIEQGKTYYTSCC